VKLIYVQISHFQKSGPKNGIETAIQLKLVYNEDNNNGFYFDSYIPILACPASV